MSAYWSHLLEARLNRRRALAASGTMVAGALFLAACGGSESKPAGKEASSLLTKPVDTSAKAVPGGVWQTSTPADVTTLDPHVNASGGGFNQLSPVYDNLVRYDRGKDGKDGSLIGDAADSWEFSPDGLTLTFKLRPNLKFDPRPPTNERVMTAADVKFSFERTVSKSAYAPDWVASRNPEAPVTSLSTPDDKTVVFKLAFPYLGMLQILAHNTYLYVLPQEADGKFDPRSEARGTGPFMLDKWLPSQRFEFKKNPDWIEKDKKRPFLDGIQRTIVPTTPPAWLSSRPATSGTTPLSRKTCCESNETTRRWSCVRAGSPARAAAATSSSYLAAARFADARRPRTPCRLDADQPPDVD